MLSPKRYRDDSINTTYFNTVDSYSSREWPATAGQRSVSTSCYYTLGKKWAGNLGRNQCSNSKKPILRGSKIQTHLPALAKRKLLLGRNVHKKKKISKVKLGKGLEWLSHLLQIFHKTLLDNPLRQFDWTSSSRHCSTACCRNSFIYD